MNDPGEGSAEYVVQAALACYGRYGVTRTTMDDIASEAQVSRAALYYHFPNRTTLLLEVVRRQEDQTLREVARALKGRRPGVSTIVHAMALIMDYALESELAALFLGIGGGKFAAAVVADELVQARQVQFWSPLFAEARQRGDLRTDLSDDDLLTFFSVTQPALMVLGPAVGVDSAAARRAYLDRFVAPALVRSR